MNQWYIYIHNYIYYYYYHYYYYYRYYYCFIINYYYYYCYYYCYNNNNYYYIYITLIHIYIYYYIYIIMISGDIISYCGSGYNRCWLWWGLCGIPSWWHRQPGWIPYGTQSLLDSPQCHIWIAMKYPIYSPFWPVKNKSHDISPVVVDNKPHLPGKSSRNDYDHHLNHSS